MKRLLRYHFAEWLSLIVMIVVALLFYADYCQRSSDRFKKGDMDKWTEELKKENPELSVPPAKKE